MPPDLIKVIILNLLAGNHARHHHPPYNYSFSKLYRITKGAFQYKVGQYLWDQRHQCVMNVHMKGR